MTGHELRQNLERFFGEHWRAPAAEWLGMSIRALERQVGGEVDVRGPIIAAIECRVKLEKIQASWRRRAEAWITKGARMGKIQRTILENAATGRHLLTERPTNGKYVGIWEAQILGCQDRGWLDEDRRITAEGLSALAVAAGKNRTSQAATPAAGADQGQPPRP